MIADEIQHAWFFAARRHVNQRYYTPRVEEHLPYLVHLGAVVQEVQEALRHDSGLDPRLTILCAILHDVLEDTATTEQEIKDRFGVAVTTGVKALTKDETLPDKRAQMTDSLARIRLQPREVAAVKLSDRIANLAPPPAHWDAAKVAAYRAEAELILTELGDASDYLRERLTRKIAAYGSR